MLFKDMTCDRKKSRSAYVAREVDLSLVRRGFAGCFPSISVGDRLLPIVDCEVGWYRHPTKGTMEVNLTRFFDGDFKVAVTFYRGSQVSESYLCYGWDDLWRAVDPDDTEE